MKDCIKYMALWLIALPALLFSCTREESPVPEGEDGPTYVIPYRATVEHLGQTRASLDAINRYIFELGDSLFLSYTDPEDASKKVFGVLCLVAGEGASVATFEGELKSVGFMPNASTPLKATLVGNHDKLHHDELHTNLWNGEIGTNSAAALPKSAYATTFAEAVQRFSELTGTSTFGSYSFCLEQQMSFLVFSVTFDPAKLPPANKDDVTLTITSLNGEGTVDDVTLFSGLVPVTDNVTDLQSNFVVALPSTTLCAKSTLSNASIVFTYNGGTAITDGSWTGIDQVLVKNNYYIFDKTQIQPNCFTIEAKEDGTEITFNYTKASHGIQYSTDNGEHWNDVTNASIPLAAHQAILVQGNASKLKKGTYGEVLFTSAGNKPCYIYGDIMTLVWGKGYDPAMKALIPGDGSGNNKNLFEGLFKNNNFIDIPSGRPLKLPNATVKECYKSMFEGCTSLTHAPALPATIVAEGAYRNMFKGCTGLTSAPALPATTVEQYGYNSMFMNCTSLISAPMIMDGTTTTSCCESMFEGCTSLLVAPRLDAGSIGDSGYKHMFYGCSSLLAAPDLGATDISDNAYLQMFMGCTSMTSAPTILPATELKYRCYEEMFRDCVSLANVPALPATNDVATPPAESYCRMFMNCQSINSLPAGQPDLPLVKIGTDGCREMFRECTGLVAAPQLASLTEVGEGGCYGMFYSCSEVTTIPSVLKPTSIPADAYREMFNRCPRITETPDIKASSMGANACRSMFFGCTRLRTIRGELLPTTLAQGVYCYMFSACTSLETVPSSLLPATTMAQECYLGMFMDCTSLKAAPKLPATTLAKLCYKQMFKNCKALTGTVNLPAGDLKEGCYFEMFNGASQFNSLMCLATQRWDETGSTFVNDLTSSCTNWLTGTKSTGTFYYATGFSIKGTSDPASNPGWVYPSNSGIRENWTYLEFHLEPIFPPNNPFDPEEDL